MKRLFLLLFLSALGIKAQAATFEVDGCFECGSENYQLGYEVIFELDSGTLAEGAMYFGQDGNGDKYLYLMLATEYVDTIYAEKGGTPPGWDTKRDFGKIEGSDSLGHVHGTAGDPPDDPLGHKDNNPLIFEDLANGNTIHMVVDLISECFDDTCNNGSGWDTGGFTMAGVEEDGNHSGKVIQGDTSSILDVNTSMAYNVGLIGASFDPEAAMPVHANWLDYVGYEFKFDSSMFGNDWITDSAGRAGKYVTALGAHASPEKEDLENVTVDPDCIPGKCGGNTQSVPEPESIALLGLALAALVSRRRKLS